MQVPGSTGVQEFAVRWDDGSITPNVVDISVDAVSESGGNRKRVTAPVYHENNSFDFKPTIPHRMKRRLGE
jgi:hypothetical protein